MSIESGRPPYSDEEIVTVTKALLSLEAMGVWVATNEGKKVFNPAEILQFLLGGTLWVCSFKSDVGSMCRFDAGSARRLFLELRRQEIAAQKTVRTSEFEICRMVERHEKRRVKNVNGGHTAWRRG